MYLDTVGSSTTKTPSASTQPTSSPQGALRYREDVGVRNSAGQFIGQVRLLEDENSRVWAFGADRRAAPYDVTGKEKGQIARGVANGNYGRLTLFPAPAASQAPRPAPTQDRPQLPLRGLNDVGVQNAKGEFLGQVRVYVDQAGERWVGGRGRDAFYKATGKGDFEIARGVARGDYSRLVLLDPPAGTVTAAERGGRVSARPGTASTPVRRSEAEYKASVTRYLDKVVSSNSEAKSLDDFKKRFAVIDRNGNVDLAVARTWKLVENEAYKSTSGRVGVEPVTGKIGSKGMALQLNDPPVPKNLANGEKPAPNPWSSVVYAATGFGASTVNLINAGMTRPDALKQGPAGFLRDFANYYLTQTDELKLGPIKVPLNPENPIEKVAVKGGVGALLVGISNTLVEKIYPAAKPPQHIGVALLTGPAVVNGTIVAKDELVKRGWFGGPAPKDPKNMGEWFHKWFPESAAIGVGVMAHILPAVIWKSSRMVKTPPPPAPMTWGQMGGSTAYLKAPPPTSMNWPELVKTGALLIATPTLQTLFANLITNAPKDVRDLMATPGSQRSADSNAKSFLMNFATLVKLGMIDPAMSERRPTRAESDLTVQAFDRAQIGYSSFLRSPTSENNLVRGTQALGNLGSAFVNLLAMPADLVRTEFEKELGDPTRAQRMVDAIERFKANAAGR